MRYSYTIGKVGRSSYSACLKISNTISSDPTYIHALCLIKNSNRYEKYGDTNIDIQLHLSDEVELH